MRNCLSRALGIRPVVRPDLTSINLRPADRFLLCSDGFHGYVRDTEWLSQALDEGSLSDIPQVFIEFANEAGGSDNITTVIVEAIGRRYSGVVPRGAADLEEPSGVVAQRDSVIEEPSGVVAQRDSVIEEPSGVVVARANDDAEEESGIVPAGLDDFEDDDVPTVVTRYPKPPSE